MPIEEGDRVVAVPDLARDLLVAAHDLAHARFDPLEIFGRERLGTREIVVKPGFGRRPESDLRVGIQFLDRFRHDMGRIVAQDLEPFRHLPSDDRNSGVMVDHGREIARPAVDPNRDRRLRQTRPNRGGDFGTGDRTGKFETLAIRQGYDDRRHTRQTFRPLGGRGLVVHRRALGNIEDGRFSRSPRLRQSCHLRSSIFQAARASSSIAVRGSRRG